MPSAAYMLETCRGAQASGCRFALAIPEEFVSALQTLVSSVPPPAAFSALERPLCHHEQFRLALCACPNGCARPHIADLGIIAFSGITVEAQECAGCGACSTTCPDKAIQMANNIAAINSASCLGCGQCAAVCPEQALLPGPLEFRIILGGHLGRRPQLGQESPERLDAASALSLAEECLDAYRREMRPGLRFADLGLRPRPHQGSALDPPKG